MQVNNIALSANKCSKPNTYSSFKGNDFGSSEKRKVRYKHYEQMSDDVLSVRSIMKAHQDVQKSGKMRMYKAIPAIATGLVATSLAITQPGKLSAKAATGLGFLAVMAGVDAIRDLFTSNKDADSKKKTFAAIGALGALAAGTFGILKGKGKTEAISQFVQKEANQLSNEINATKLAELSDKYVEPFIQKHHKAAIAAPIITAISTGIAGGAASASLLKGISKDVSKQACINFQKAKQIQQIAKNHFDSVDAKEV